MTFTDEQKEAMFRCYLNGLNFGKLTFDADDDGNPIETDTSSLTASMIGVLDYRESRVLDYRESQPGKPWTLKTADTIATMVSAAMQGLTDSE